MLVLSNSETPRDSLSDVTPEVSRNTSIRVESLGSNHRVGELINVGWRFVNEPRLRVWWQTKSQVNAELF
jgi:hypothetical protein